MTPACSTDTPAAAAVAGRAEVQIGMWGCTFDYRAMEDSKLPSKRNVQVGVWFVQLMKLLWR